MSNQFLSNIKAAFGIGAVKPSTTGEQKVVRETGYSRVKKEENVDAFDAVDKRYNEFVKGFKDVADAAPLSEGLAIVRDLTQEVVNEEVALASTEKAEERQRKVLNAFDKIEAQQGLLATSVLAKQSRINELETKIKERATLVETRSKEVGQRLTLQELAARAAAKVPVKPAEPVKTVVETVTKAPAKNVESPKSHELKSPWSEGQLKMINVLTNRFAEAELVKSVKAKGLAIKVVTANNKVSALTCLKQMPHQVAVLMVEWLAKSNFRKEVWEAALAELPTPKAPAQEKAPKQEEVNTLPEPINGETPEIDAPTTRDIESAPQKETPAQATQPDATVTTGM